MSTFKCEKCDGVFNKKHSDDKAKKEFYNTYSHILDEEINLICEECFNKFAKSFYSLNLVLTS